MMASSDGLLSHIWPKRLFLAGGYENFPVEIRRGPNLGRFWFLNTVSRTHVMGTLGVMVPHLAVKKNPCTVMKRKEQNVTRFPIPGSFLK